MSFETDHPVAHRALADAEAGRSLPEIMAGAMDVLDEWRPLPLWSQLRSIDFADDVRLATGSIPEIIAIESPPTDLSAIWFGLYEVSETSSPLDTSSVVRLSGGTAYPDDDWLYRQGWYPDAYVPTPGLASLAPAAALVDVELAAGGPAGYEIYRIATYDLAFAHALGLAADVVRGEAGAVLLGGRERLGVAAGFHDGDIAFIGELSADGLDQSTFSA